MHIMHYTLVKYSLSTYEYRHTYWTPSRAINNKKYIFVLSNTS